MPAKTGTKAMKAAAAKAGGKSGASGSASRKIREERDKKKAKAKKDDKKGKKVDDKKKGAKKADKKNDAKKLANKKMASPKKKVVSPKRKAASPKKKIVSPKKKAGAKSEESDKKRLKVEDEDVLMKHGDDEEESSDSSYHSDSDSDQEMRGSDSQEGSMSGSEGGDERSDHDSEEDEDDDSDDDDENEDEEMEMEQNVAKPSEERGVDSSQERASESREREDDWLVNDIPGEGDAEGVSPGKKRKYNRHGKASKDPNEPPQGRSAQDIWAAESNIRELIIEKYPDLGKDNHKGDLKRKVTRAWRRLRGGMMKSFEKKSREEKQQYEIALRKHRRSKLYIDWWTQEQLKKYAAASKKLEADFLPARHVSAYFLFGSEVREEPGFADKCKSLGDAAKIIAERWNALSEADKEVYEDEKKKLDKRRAEECKRLKASEQYQDILRQKSELKDKLAETLRQGPAPLADLEPEMSDSEHSDESDNYKAMKADCAEKKKKLLELKEQYLKLCQDASLPSKGNTLFDGLSEESDASDDEVEEIEGDEHDWAKYISEQEEEEEEGEDEDKDMEAPVQEATAASASDIPPRKSPSPNDISDDHKKKFESILGRKSVSASPPANDKYGVDPAKRKSLKKSFTLA